MDRAEVSRRLKAARALRGIKVTELATREPLKRNGITANLVGETERQERDAREMELRVIAEALDLPATFLLAEDPFAVAGAPAPQLDRIAALLEQNQELILALATALTPATPAEGGGPPWAALDRLREELAARDREASELAPPQRRPARG